MINDILSIYSALKKIFEWLADTDPKVSLSSFFMVPEQSLKSLKLTYTAIFDSVISSNSNELVL